MDKAGKNYSEGNVQFSKLEERFGKPNKTKEHADQPENWDNEEKKRKELNKKSLSNGKEASDKARVGFLQASQMTQNLYTSHKMFGGITALCATIEYSLK